MQVRMQYYILPLSKHGRPRGWILAVKSEMANFEVVPRSILQTWVEALQLLQTPGQNRLFDVLINIKHSKDKLDM